MERPQIQHEDRPETIWVRVDGDCLLNGDVKGAHTSAEAAGSALGRDEVLREITLMRPTLTPTYGGPTLVEALWAEMDRLMEALMTGQAAEGDKYRAEELAWVLAIVTNPYEPSMDRIRAETMDRWKDQQRFEAEQESMLNPEEEEPAGGSTLNSEDQD